MSMPRNPARQVPCDVAVAITTACRDGFEAAIRSVYAQDCDGRIQLLLGLERPGHAASLQRLAAEAPERVAVCVFEAPQSADDDRTGRLRAALGYAANSRNIAYLDDNSRYAPHHLRTLLAAAEARNGAISCRSGPPMEGADPSLLLIDKLHAPAAPGVWGSPTAADGLMAVLEAGRGLGRTNRASVIPATVPQDPASDPRVDSYFAAHRRYRLLIGAGDRVPPGWLHCSACPEQESAVSIDLRSRLPFLDATFDDIMLSHCLRGVTLASGRRLLGECHRLLRPGGGLCVAERDLALVLRLPATPGEARDVEHAAARRSDAPPEAVFDPLAFAVNRLFADGSRPTVYDRTLLAAMLHASGFVDIRTAPPEALLRTGIDPFAVAEPVPALPFETVVFAAQRPSAKSP